MNGITEIASENAANISRTPCISSNLYIIHILIHAYTYTYVYVHTEIYISLYRIIHVPSTKGKLCQKPSSRASVLFDPQFSHSHGNFSRIVCIKDTVAIKNIATSLNLLLAFTYQLGPSILNFGQFNSIILSYNYKNLIERDRVVRDTRASTCIE